MDKHRKMFILWFNRTKIYILNEEKYILYESLKQKYFAHYRNTQMDCQHLYEYNFVINNNRSKINGYHENWIMQCQHIHRSEIEYIQIYYY